MPSIQQKESSQSLSLQCFKDRKSGSIWRRAGRTRGHFTHAPYWEKRCAELEELGSHFHPNPMIASSGAAETITKEADQGIDGAEGKRSTEDS